MLGNLPINLFVLGFIFVFMAVLFDGLLARTGYDKNCPQKYFGNMRAQSLLLYRFVARLFAGITFFLLVLSLVFIACTSAMCT